MEEDEEEPVPLPNVNAAILRKVIQWCSYHKDDPPPPEDDENKEKRTDDICSWDAEFLKVDQGTLFELILVSDRLFHLYKILQMLPCRFVFSERLIKEITSKRFLNQWKIFLLYHCLL